jgi:vitamin B12 transporter
MRRRTLGITQRFTRLGQFRLIFLPLFSLVAFACCLGFAIGAYGQETATIEGMLTDPTGGAVSGANIVAQGTASPANRSEALSGTDGRFRLSVASGRYRVTITAGSFKRVEQVVEVRGGETREIKAQLAIEPLSASVLVSAAAQPIETEAASEPVDIVTHEEIERRQAIELAPLLETVPGFSLGQTGPEGGVTSLFLDGGNSNFTKVLVDGVPANLPGGAVDFSNFTLDNVDKVEIVHGAESALSGSDAVSGTVEILTHRGSTRTPLLLLESDGGSFGTGRGLAQVSGMTGRLDYSAAAAYFDTAGQGVNDHFLNRTLSGNFGLQLAERNALRLTVRDNTSDAGEPGQTLFTPPDLDAHNGLHNLMAGATWDIATGTHWQHRVFASETDVHQLFQNLLSDFFISPDPFGECEFKRSPQAVASAYCDFPYNSKNQYNRAEFEAQSTYTNRHFAVSAGYQYEVENAFLADLSGLHARRNNQAGFIDGRWQATGRLVLNAGFRAEDNANFGTRGAPRAGAAYVLRYGRDFWNSTRLRFAYGQGIKEPSLDQSFGTDLCNPGNPSLRPEESRTIHAGIEQSMAGDKVNISADYFFNKFRNIVSFTECFPGGPCPVTPPAGCPFGFGTFFNTDLARARGVNLKVAARARRWLGLNGSYSYDDSRVLASPNAFDPVQAPGNRLLRRPVNSGSIAIDTAVRRFNGNLTGVFVGRRADSDFLFPALGLTSNPGYVRFDLAASFRVTSRLSIIGRVQNLFNESYQDVLGYPALHRGAYAGLRFRLGGDT